MATLRNRTVKFTFEGKERTGVIVESSSLGALLINIIDDLDNTKQVILPPEVPVKFWSQQ